MNEIHTDNKKKILAPFDYQLRLLAEEKADILAASQKAKINADNEIDDLCNRMDEHYSHLLEDLRTDTTRLKNAIRRAIVDRK